MNFWQRLAHYFLGTSSFMEFAGSPKNLKDIRQETELFVQDVNPSFPLESIPLIKKLVIAFPDLSQAVKRALTLGNSGIDWKIDADENGKKRIQADIDSFFKKHRGITNHLLRQVLTTGALSAEIVPSLNLDSVEEIRLISVENVRFKKQLDENNIVRFVPYEKGKFGYTRLNEEQYSYEAIEREEDSPYAIPPFLSAIRWINSQFKTQDNIDKTLNKWGLLGFIIAKFKRPRLLPGTDAKTYENQQKEFLQGAKASFEKNSQSGFLATYDDTTVEHHTLTDASKTGGFEAISRYIEEQISSGADTDLFILGRSYSVTEAYAKIAGKLFLLKLGNFAYPVIQLLIRAITLDQLLKGNRFRSIDASWKKSISLDPLADAQAKLAEKQVEAAEFQLILAMVKSGAISPDDGAKLLGRDKWFEPDKLETQGGTGFGFSESPDLGSKKKLLMNRQFEQTSRVCGDLDTLVELGAWTNKEREVYASIEDAFVSHFFSSYEDRVKEALNQISKKGISKTDAINSIWDTLEKELGQKFPEETAKAWREAISKAWDAGQDTKNPNSKTNPPKVQANKYILDFFNKGYKFDVGKQFDRKDDINKIEEAIREAVETGSTDEVIRRLQDELLGPATKEKPGKKKEGAVPTEDPRARLRRKLGDIVRGQILRSRNFSRTERFEQIGIKKLEVVAVMDDHTSYICRAMNGKTIEVRTCVQYVREFLADDPTRENFWKDRQNPSESELRQLDISSKSGDEITSFLRNKMPPYHAGGCRTTVVTDFSVETTS
ncbi:phage head morphogenesis protein [Leptospira noguchii]|uniref:phage head morphogenesis protein n=1 Tax=Leptospira noguchii TaxID=28182 RepID=UPI001FB737D4|nr:phage head morphogenesis protein [Leptospira noguchii]UOG42505.1 phage head morphogenesis protein [Leptospira noguchii]